ncbi:hypothetical protein D9757_015228 [Collybiopsis confluens]|uniref:Major facilitator superfamily (MFS) profile domain-containing protein n=1 Tax=Collybiopsis confluens TaxID=2823264 RepID=A0A8H5C1K8_9AGAR|nr:hypothetical protein D9757_015228 [Collybiopsis confluens]
MSSSPQAQEKKLANESVVYYEHSSDHDRDSSKFANLDPVELRILEKKAVRRLDIVILPMISMFYFLSFLDRSNIGNARVAGLQKALGMTDHQYQICITILYVPYICAELPSNLLLRKIGPRYLMPSLLTAWGLVSSFAGLTTVRAFLGLLEGPMFPGIVLYLSSFYTRDELAVRVAIFFSSASLSGAFSGLLAAAILKMDGLGGRPGWAYIFIIVSASSPYKGLCYLTLLLARRLARDNPSSSTNQDDFSFKEVIRSLKSPHVLLVFTVLYMVGTVLYGQALFLPSIVNQLGFSPNKTQLLSVGPFAGGFFVTLLGAIWSESHQMSRNSGYGDFSCRHGGIFHISHKDSTDKFTRYGSLFLTVPGVYAVIPPLAAWVSNNSEPHYRRATSIALGFIATNLGGITSTWLFPTKDAPITDERRSSI